MGSAAGEKALRLFVLGNNEDAKLKIEAIDLKAKELQEKHPELHFGINDAAFNEKMAIMRAEMKAAADEAVVAGDEMEAVGKKAEHGSEVGAKAWEATKLALIGVGGGLVYGVYKAAEFNQKMELIHTGAGVAQSKLAALGSGVLQLAGQVGENPDSLAESLYHVESAFGSMGLSGPKALGLVKIAAEGAKVGQADLVDVTNALGASVASGIPGVQNYSQAMGALNAIVGSGDMHMQDLAEAMGSGMLATVKGFGLSLTDVGAALATFGDNNIRGRDAATALRQSVMSLAVPSAQGKKQLEEWGLSANTFAKDMQSHGLIGALDHLHRLFKANGVTAKQQGEVITEMFGKKAGAGLNVLMDQMDRLHSKYHEIAKGANEFGSAWDAQKQQVKQQLDELKGGSEALAITMGQKLLPVASDVVKWLTGFVNGLEHGSAKAQVLVGILGAVLTGIVLLKLEEGLKGAFEGFENLWKAGSKIVGWAGQLAVKLGILTATQEAETVATGEAEAAQVGLNMAFLASPITWIVAGLVLIGIGVYELIKHSAAFRHFWVATWHDVTHWISVAWNWIKGNWPLLLAVLVGPVAIAAFEIYKHWHQIVAGAEWVYHELVGWFHSLRGSILHLVSDFGHLLWNAGVWLIKGLIGGIGSMAGAVWDKVKSIGSGIVHGFTSVLGISSPSRVFAEHGKNIVLGLVQGIDGYAHLAEASVSNLAQRSIGASGGRFAGHAASGRDLTIEWVGGSGADAEFITWLKKNIRIRGGDPGVLGR